MAGPLFPDAEMKLESLVLGKVSRKVKAYGKKAMAVEVYFEKGAEGAVHAHPHDQVTYCLEGRFEFSLGDKRYALSSGDSIFVEGGSAHGVVCTERGRLLDFFSPAREDFL